MRISDWSSDVCSSDLDPGYGKPRSMRRRSRPRRRMWWVEMEGPEHVPAGPRECIDPSPGVEGLRQDAQDVAAGAGRDQDGGADRRRLGAESDPARRRSGQGQPADGVQAGQGTERNRPRSEPRRGEKEWVDTGVPRWAPY